MLHHRDPAARRRDALDLVAVTFFDRAEVDLLVVVGVGVDRRAGEGEVEARPARWRVAVAHELVVDQRADRGARLVDDLVAHADRVVAAREGIGLDQLDAAAHRRLELDLKLVRPGLEHALADHRRHQRVVLWELARPGRRRPQAGLRDVVARGRAIEQDHVLLRERRLGRAEPSDERLVPGLFDRLLVLQQFDPDDVAAGGVEGRVHQVGRDRDLLARDRCRRRRWRRRGGNAGRGRDCGRRCGRRCRRGAATCAGGGPNIVGWPLWRLHDSQMKNSEAMKMPQSRVRRMSVMTAVERTRGRARRAREAK